MAEAVYVSTSGVPHCDVADLQAIRGGRGWDPGDPAGINDHWRDTTNATMNAIAAENPNAVFHTGDMVMGYWGRDVNNTGIFGPGNTLEQRRQMAWNAANCYYGDTKRFWANAGIPSSRIHYAPGDHEMGGVDTDGHVPTTKFAYQAHAKHYDAWVRNFTGSGRKYSRHPPGQHAKSAYAVTLPGNCLLISLDPFNKRDTGLYYMISDRQLDWAVNQATSFKAGGGQWVFVQCEVPTKGRNRYRNSSRTYLRNRDAVWQAMIDADIDLFLAAEFHDTTAHSNNHRRPLHIVHGGALAYNYSAYLVITVFAGRLDLEAKEAFNTVTDRSLRLWQLDDRWRPPRKPNPAPFATFGTAVLHADGALSDRTGQLKEGPGSDPAE